MNEIALPELGLEFGVNMFHEASPSPSVIQVYVLKKLLHSYPNTSAVQVNNHSFNQLLIIINQPRNAPFESNGGKHMCSCMYACKKQTNKQTKVATTKKNKSNYGSKVIKLRFLSQIIE